MWVVRLPRGPDAQVNSALDYPLLSCDGLYGQTLPIENGNAQCPDCPTRRNTSEFVSVLLTISAVGSRAAVTPHYFLSESSIAWATAPFRHLSDRPSPRTM